MALPHQANDYIYEASAYNPWKELGGKVSAAEWDLMCKDGPLVLHVLYADFVIYTRQFHGHAYLPVEPFTAAINAQIDDVEDDVLVEEKSRLLTRVRELDGIEKEKDQLAMMVKNGGVKNRERVSGNLRKAFLALQEAKLSLQILSEEDKKLAKDNIDTAISILTSTLCNLAHDD
jgi:hypothetical protein